MKTRLVSYRGGKIDLAFPLQGPRVTIGREPDNLIQLPHEKVSKHHAALRQIGETWLIEDLHSTNGVFVNGQRVEGRELKDGDQVRIGPFEFFFELNVPSDDWVPSHIIDLSSQVHQQTIRRTNPPGEEKTDAD
jgi:pSer/pThr/pTyr-binding forkhead associated (FHA) protein